MGAANWARHENFHQQRMNSDTIQKCKFGENSENAKIHVSWVDLI